MEYDRSEITCASKYSRPSRDERVERLTLTLGELLALQSYPVRYTDAAVTRRLRWADAGKTPIRLRDWVKRPDLHGDWMAQWYRPDLGPVRQPSASVMWCTGCDRHIVVDGNHRLTWLGLRDLTHVSVEISRLSGREWPRVEDDVTQICACVARSA